MDLQKVHLNLEQKLELLLAPLPGVERRTIKRCVEAGMIGAWRKGFKEGQTEGRLFSSDLGGEA